MPIHRQIVHWVMAALLPVLVPGSAVAQECSHDAPLSRCRVVQAVEVVDRVPAIKSPTKALLWSLLGTVVPAGAVVLMASGEPNGFSDAPGAVSLVLLGSVLIGPSLGHFYSARPGRALVGIGIRSVALVGLAGGFAAAWNNNTGGGELMIASLALGGAVLAYDVIRAPHSARVHNERIRSARIAIGLTGSSHAPGLRIGAKVSF